MIDACITYTPEGREYLNQALKSGKVLKTPIIFSDGVRTWSPECKAYERYPYLFQ